MLTEPTADNHPEQIIRRVLIGLGVPEDQAQRIAFMPLPTPGAVTGPIFSRLKERKTRPVKSAVAPALRAVRMKPQT